MKIVPFKNNGIQCYAKAGYSKVLKEADFTPQTIASHSQEFYQKLNDPLARQELQGKGVPVVKVDGKWVLLLKRDLEQFVKETIAGEKTPHLLHVPIGLINVNGQTRAAYNFLDNYVNLESYLTQLKRIDLDKYHATRLKLASKLGTALRELHEKGITHGDLHQRNIMIKLNEHEIEDLRFIDLSEAKLGVKKDAKHGVLPKRSNTLRYKYARERTRIVNNFQKDMVHLNKKLADFELNANDEERLEFLKAYAPKAYQKLEGIKLEKEKKAAIKAVPRWKRPFIALRYLFRKLRR